MKNIYVNYIFKFYVVDCIKTFIFWVVVFIYLFIISFFLLSYAPKHSPPTEDHHPSNYRNISGTQRLETSLMYSMLSVLTFTLLSTSPSLVMSSWNVVSYYYEEIIISYEQ